MKKKSALLCLLTGLIFHCFGQTGNPLKITLEPSKSFGFLGWTAHQSNSYLVSITKKKTVAGQVVFEPVSSYRTTNNYLKMDHILLNQPGIFYQVQAINESNGTVVADSEPAQICPECNVDTWTCSKTCNGVTYAYTLNVTADNSSNMGRVWISNAYSTVAPNANVGNYYYEAITPTQFGLRAQDIAINNLDWYVMTNVVSSQQIRDANNVVLTGTVYFVQKTLGMFSWADGNRSTDFVANQTTDCNLNAMINRMNQFPSPENNATGTLQCFPAWPSQTGSGGGVVNKPYNGPGSSADVLVTYYTLSYYIIDCYSGELSNELFIHFGCDQLAGGGIGGGLPTSPDFGSGKLLYVKVSNVNNPSISMNLQPSQIFDSKEDYIAPVLNMPSGLYRMTFVFDDFSAAQFLAEHKADDYEPITNSTFATLTVAPNPIKNETLIYDVSVKRNMSFTAEVYSLDGDLISTEVVRLKKGESMHRSISIPKVTYPYSQVRVKLIFADNSFLEEIVSTE